MYDNIVLIGEYNAPSKCFMMAYNFDAYFFVDHFIVFKIRFYDLYDCIKLLWYEHKTFNLNGFWILTATCACIFWCFIANLIWKCYAFAQ